MPIRKQDVPLRPLNLPSRPRRNRLNEVIRQYHRETYVGPQHLVLPLFIWEGPKKAIGSMPGCYRHNMETLVKEVAESVAVGIKSFVLFPKVKDELKDPTARQCFNPTDIVPRAIRLLKKQFPDIVIYSDVALDPYSSDGHDGIVSTEGEILNDETVAVLVKQALCHAEAGVDIISPSDMQDGRIGAIRTALDANGFTNVLIMSYSVKYASSFYGPFRDALDSAPKSASKSVVPTNKYTYQMDPANSREALRELALDVSEGADIVMVKPGLPYLDIVYRARQNVNIPVAVYQVSGEYAMLKAASINGWLEEKKVVMESLIAIRRAGADIIFTYFAKQVATWLRDDLRARL